VILKIGATEYRIEPLGSDHDRVDFCCGVPDLDDYLQRQAGQDLKRKLATVFILTDDTRTVAGFYTLSAHSTLASNLPQQLAKGLPRFPLPMTLLGRMAVNKSLHGLGLGQFLLLDALDRARRGSHQVASWGVVVDAKAGARSFYLKHGFSPTLDRPERLVLPMKVIEKMFDPS
jgi:predicted GNAT family N-acyltransferase